MPELSVNLTLLHAVRSYGYDGLVALTAHRERDVEVLSGRDGVVVVRPPLEAASRLVDRLPGGRG